MNLNHNKNYFQNMTEEEFLDDPDFQSTKISRKELKTKGRNKEGEEVHDINNGKVHRKY